METDTTPQLTAAQARRVQEVWSRTVAALQEVVRDLRVTEDELHAAADFLARAGRSGVFRSLVDVTLAVTSIEAAQPGVGTRTRSNVEGPFYRSGAPFREDGALAEQTPSPNAQELVLTGRVIDAENGRPVPGAVLDVWQADEHGAYDGEGFHLRGLVRSGQDGAYRVQTVVPADYEQHQHDPIGELYRLLGRHSFRAAHIHVKVWRDGDLVLTTQFFMPDSPILDSDYVIGAVHPDLVINKRRAGERRWEAEFDFVVGRAGA